MAEVLALLPDHDGELAGVIGTAEVIARVLDLEVTRMTLTEEAEKTMSAESLVAAVESPDVAVAVVPAGSGPASWARLIRSLSVPVVLVPAEASAAQGISQALVPLDGAPGTAESVRPHVRALRRSGVRIRAVHVFDETTVPRFWDQAGHEAGPWRQQFLDDAAVEASELELRSGDPVAEVMSQVGSGGIDLVLLAWSQSVDPLRARLVTAALDARRVAVMLVPVGPPPEPPEPMGSPS